LQKELPQQAEQVVFLTGGAFTPKTHEFVARFPATRVLSKPFRLETLRALVERRLRRSS